MANEAILMVETELPVPINVADGTALEKGTVLQLGDNNVGTKTSGADEVFGGILESEKIADDGMVRIDVYRRGLFRVKASGSIAMGAAVGTTAFLNEVIHVTGALSGSRILGTALETAADGETFLMELNPQTVHQEI